MYSRMAALRKNDSPDQSSTVRSVDRSGRDPAMPWHNPNIDSATRARNSAKFRAQVERIHAASVRRVN